MIQMNNKGCPPGFILTDASTKQCVKRISDTEFIVRECGQIVEVDIARHTDEELEEYISPYYDGGREEVIRVYGTDANQIIAEIIAETDTTCMPKHMRKW